MTLDLSKGWRDATVDPGLKTTEPVNDPWLLACEELDEQAQYLRLRVDKGIWVPMPGLDPCGPNGLAGRAFPPARLILPDCPVGALIGRIGGSSATLGNIGTECQVFAVGKYAIVPLNNSIGPLFLGFNIRCRPVTIQQAIDVRIQFGYAASTAETTAQKKA